MNITATDKGTYVLVQWTSPAGQEGYVALLDGAETLADGKRHFSGSRTASSVKIGKPDQGRHTYGVMVLGGVDTGSAPIPADTSPPVNPPIMDFRATVPTFMPTTGVAPAGQNLILPWGSKVVPAYRNSDITVVDDATWGKVFRCRINGQSNNPWFIPADNRHSCEMQYHQSFTQGTDDWYAQSVHLVSGAQYLPANVDDGWMLYDQNGYLGITSPAVGLELRANGLGLDANPGRYNGSTTPMNLVVRSEGLWPLGDFMSGYVDTILHIRWSTTASGIRELWARSHGASRDFVQVRSETGVVTAQTDTDGVFKTAADDKQGLYKGYLPLSRALPNPAFEVVVAMRGMTKHAFFGDAVAALA